MDIRHETLSADGEAMMRLGSIILEALDALEDFNKPQYVEAPIGKEAVQETIENAPVYVPNSVAKGWTIIRVATGNYVDKQNQTEPMKEVDILPYARRFSGVEPIKGAIYQEGEELSLVYPRVLLEEKGVGLKEFLEVSGSNGTVFVYKDDVGKL